MLAQLLRGVATGSLKEVSSEGWDAYSACTAQTRRSTRTLLMYITDWEEMLPNLLMGSYYAQAVVF